MSSSAAVFRRSILTFAVVASAVLTAAGCTRSTTAPPKGLFAHAKGGFFHDGRFVTLKDVIEHYDGALKLGLTQAERADLEQYLKSL